MLHLVTTTLLLTGCLAIDQWPTNPGPFGGNSFGNAEAPLEVNPSGLGGAVGGPLLTGRNAQQASLQTGDAMDTILGLLTVDDLGSLPIDTVDQIPAENLAKLPPPTLAQMPDSVLAKLSADAHVKSTIAGETIQYLPVDKLAQPSFPWEQVIQGLPPDSINSFSPTVMGTIPWERVMPQMPPDTLAGMSLSSMQVIPPAAWAKTSPQQIAAINPTVLSRLPLSSLKAIPPANLASLPPAQLSGFSTDILKTLDPSVMQQAQGVKLAGDTHAEALGLVGPANPPAGGAAPPPPKRRGRQQRRIVSQ